MNSNDAARIESQTPMEVINRVLTDVGDIERITVVCQTGNGSAIHLYSNARSEAELNGMLTLASKLCGEVL